MNCSSDSSGMDIERIARRLSDKTQAKKSKKKVSKPKLDIPEISFDVLDPGVEYSYKIDLSLTVDFEGDASEVSEDRLRRKLKSELIAALKGASLITADDFRLRATNVKVNPISISSALNDQTSVDDR